MKLSAVLSGVVASDHATATAAQSVSLQNTVPAQEAASKFVNAAGSALSIFNGIRSLVVALVILALIFGGMGCIIGGEDSRHRFRSAIPWIVFGSCLMLFSLSIAGVIFHSFYTAAG